MTRCRFEHRCPHFDCESQVCTQDAGLYYRLDDGFCGQYRQLEDAESRREP